MRVDLLDPSAYTPPYDRALASALAARGAEVRLLTSAFPYGSLPPVDERVAVSDFFYHGAGGAAGSQRRRLAKLAGHVRDMRAYRAQADAGVTDVAHFQWLALQQLDWALMPRRTPVLVTAHDVMPREPRPGQHAGQRRVYGRAAAVVVHSDSGRARLIAEAGVEPDRIHVIHHGAFTALGAVEGRLPPELEHAGGEGPIVLLAGLLRPYKGVDLLLDAWRMFGDDPPGRLWIVGLPRIELPADDRLGPGVTAVRRFVSEQELAGVLRAADLVTLPYREIDQSGILYSALGLGRPLLLSDVGGFPEVAAAGAAELFPAGNAEALAASIKRLLSDDRARNVLCEGARSAAASTYSWGAAADAHLDLYRTVAAGR